MSVDAVENINTSQLFSAYKEQTLKLQTNSSIIRTRLESRNIFDFSILEDTFCANLETWLQQGSKETCEITMSCFNSEYEHKLEEFELSKPLIPNNNFSETTIYGDVDDSLHSIINLTLDHIIQKLGILESDDTRTELSTIIDIQKCRDLIEADRNKYIKENTTKYNGIIRKLSGIKKSCEDIKKQNGTNTQYIGYYFISGIFDGVKINAPILLIPVDIVSASKGFVRINLIQEKDILINKPLLLVLSTYMSDMINLDTTYEDIESILKDGYTSIKKLVFKDSSLVYYNDEDTKITQIHDICSGNNRLTLYKAITIGVYNVATSIYDDYVRLENKKVNATIDRLINGNQSDYISARQYIENPVYKTADLKLITDLDSSQECAVYAADKSNGLVLYGPPGTGKSQTIVNIIANYLYKGKSILMVSEKRTALDVVYKRLRELNKFAILISDSSDIEAFKKKIEQSESYISSNNTNTNTTLDTICSGIDSDLDELNSLSSRLSLPVANTGKSLSFLFKHSENTDSLYNLVLLLDQEYKDILDISYDILHDKLKILDTDFYRNIFNLLSDNRLQGILNIDRLNWNILYSNIKSYIREYDNFVNCSISIKTLEEKKEALNHSLTLYEQLYNVVKGIKLPHQKDNCKVIRLSNENIVKAINLVKKYVDKEKYSQYIEKNLDIADIINNEFNTQYADELKIRNRIKNLLTLYEPYIDKTSDVLELNITDLDIIEFVLHQCLLSLDTLSNIASIEKDVKDTSSSEKIKEGVLDLYKTAYDNIKNLLDTFPMANYTTVIKDLDDAEYTHYLNNIFDLAYIKGSLFKKYDKENSMHYSILLSMQKKIDKEVYNRVYDINKIIDENENNLEKIKEKIGIEVKTTEDIYILINTLGKILQSLYQEKAKYLKDNKIQLTKNVEGIINDTTNYVSMIEPLVGVDLSLLYFSILRSIKAIKNSIDKCESNLANLNATLVDMTRLEDKIHSIADIKLSDLNTDDISLYEAYDNSFEEVHDLFIGDKIDRRILKLLKDGYTKEEILKAYCNAHIIQSDKNISMSIGKYDEIIKDIDKLDAKKTDLTLANIVTLTEDIINQFKGNNTASLHKIQLELQRKRNRKSIRQIVSEYSDTVIPLYRVWMLTPDVVSDILPLKEDLFDVAIFDEASQIYLYNALPSLYRAKKAIISGDDKQLRPTSFFTREIGTEENLDYLDENVGKETSLLDQAKVNLNSISLLFHYRSKFAELIQYSNFAFYDGRLKLAPNVVRISQDIRPIDYILTDGERENSTNKADAICTVELLNKLLLETNYTIGIVTLNIGQKELINNLIIEKSEEDDTFNTLIVQASNRVDDSEDVSLFIKAIEEVQGDERDIIIMSLGLGVNDKGKVPLTQLGPILKQGGANRLNVMISRAKVREYIITSVRPTNFDIGTSKSDGASIFIEWLAYAKAVSDNDYSSIEHIIGVNTVTEPKFDSPFEEQVYIALQKLGYIVETQVGVRGYRIDLGIYDNELGKYIAGIECDGATYHSSKTARERDITRQRFLESRGWTILRIWSRNWWKNSKAEIDRIDKELKRLKETN